MYFLYGLTLVHRFVLDSAILPGPPALLPLCSVEFCRIGIPPPRCALHRSRTWVDPRCCCYKQCCMNMAPRGMWKSLHSGFSNLAWSRIPWRAYLSGGGMCGWPFVLKHTRWSEAAGLWTALWAPGSTPRSGIVGPPNAPCSTWLEKAKLQPSRWSAWCELSRFHFLQVTQPGKRKAAILGSWKDG